MQLSYLLNNMGWSDLIDILLVATVLFIVFQALEQTRAMQLLRGVVILAILGVALLLILPFNTFGLLVRIVLIAGIIALPLLFQDELRRALIGLGQFGQGRRYYSSFDRFKATIIHTVDMAAQRKEGVLIVLEGQTPLTDVIKTGIAVKAEQLSPELLKSIFNPQSPLHDGAVILRNDQLIAAGCILPVFTGYTEEAHLGTRHRAALGISGEYPDALVVLVSEETGRFSVAKSGRLFRRLSTERLGKWLDRFRNQMEGERPSRWTWLRGSGIKSTVTNLLLSIFIAFIAWLSVIYTTNPPQVKTIANVPLETIGPNTGLVVLSEIPDSVNVQVQSSTDRLSRIDASNIRAELNMSDLPAGLNQIPVEVNLSEQGVQLLSLDPSTIDLTLEPLMKREYSPRVSITDPEDLLPGYVLGKIIHSPNVVTVHGPENLVAEVVAVRGELALDGRVNDFQESVPVIPIDREGEPVVGVNSSPQRVLASVPIERTSSTVQVSVIADVDQGSIDQDYEIDQVQVNPPIVSITGSQNDLNELGNYIETEPIDLSGVQSEFSAVVPLVLPEGIVALGDRGQSVTGVEVRIDLSPKTDFQLLEKTIVQRGLDPSSQVEFLPEKVTVLSIGPKPLLDQIRDDSSLIVVYVDLNDLSPGTYYLPLEIEAPNAVDVQTFPSEVQIEIVEGA